VWTDTHCHVPYRDVDAGVVAEAKAAGVTRMISVGTDADQSAAAVDLAWSTEGVWATIGLHPHEAKLGVETILPLLQRRGPEVVGVGECGLDYYYDHSPRPLQLDVFAAQIALARSFDLTLVIHTRDAWDDTFEVLGAEGVPERTVFHCFSGGPPEARRALDVGAYLSFSGIVTFKTAEDVRAAAALCPPERLLVETDSPYLAPVPYRGKPNRPAWVALVGAAVAQARGEAVEEVERSSWDAATAAFGLSAHPRTGRTADSVDPQ
jgi:TatD DNase family protein